MNFALYLKVSSESLLNFQDVLRSHLRKYSFIFQIIFAGSEQQKAASRLLVVSRLINQAVGDALCGLLLVEAILQYMGWSIHKWNELYRDLPSRQLKVGFLVFVFCL